MIRRKFRAKGRTPEELVALLARVEAEAERVHGRSSRQATRFVHAALAEAGTDVVECYRARRALRARIR